MTTHTAPPLLYPQIRMLAEAALGVASFESATFTFDPTNTNGPLRVSPGAPTPDGVTVPVWNETKYPDPGQVLLQVETATGRLATLNAVDHNADAVFWSTAAVQKFVLPYYASCMGYGAAARLATLEKAWNGDVPGVQVFALMHVSAPPVQFGKDVPVEPLWVVFLEGEEVRAQPLAHFAGRIQGTLPIQPLPDPVAYTAPTLEEILRPYPDYTALRSMAEWSAALDMEPMYFTYDPYRRQFGEPTPHAITGGGKIVVPVFNPFGKGKRLKPSSVVFGNTELPADCDAVFWSTGAIEQFLLPYYASIDGFGGLKDLQDLQKSWTENRRFVGGNRLQGGREDPWLGPPDEDIVVVAMLHIWPSMLESDQVPRPTVRREIIALHAVGDGGSREPRLSDPREEAAGAA